MRSSASGCLNPSAASGTLLAERSLPLYPPYSLTAGTRTACCSGRYVRAHNRVRSLSRNPTIAVQAVDRERAVGGQRAPQGGMIDYKPHAAVQDAVCSKALRPQHLGAVRPCASTLIGTLLTAPHGPKGPMVYKSRALFLHCCTAETASIWASIGRMPSRSVVHRVEAALSAALHCGGGMRCAPLWGRGLVDGRRALVLAALHRRGVRLGLDRHGPRAGAAQRQRAALRLSPVLRRRRSQALLTVVLAWAVGHLRTAERTPDR